ncbi:hypothetical protein EPO44_07195 [bacterium]|nr:MAG: hypothetical protein EPO44_07195 [bacterium]
MRYVVLGGAGAMGRITVRDLFETAGDSEILIADYNFKNGQRVARSYRSSRVKAGFVDVLDLQATARLLRGAFAVINSVQYEYNLHVMKAALKAGAHYLDLGGLFHMTRKQLKLHSEFKRAGLTAILGIGAAPGITNILARFAADRLDRVQEIHIRLGSIDETKILNPPPLSSSYSIQTILEEFSYPPAVFTKGRFKFAEPMSGVEKTIFPAPVGWQYPMYTIHSEIATLPLTYKKKGIREVSFKIAFGCDFTEKIRFLRDIGLAAERAVTVKGIKVVPRDLLVQLVRSLPKPVVKGRLKEYEIIRVIVKGKKGGKAQTWIVDCHTRGMPKWGIGLDIDTGSPPSIAAQMLARGEIEARGTVPAEVALDPQPFFAELERRNMEVRYRRINAS